MIVAPQGIPSKSPMQGSPYNKYKINMKGNMPNISVRSPKPNFRNVLADPVEDVNYNPYIKKHLLKQY